MSTSPSLIRDVKLLGGRATKLWMRNPASIAGIVIFPVVFFSLFNLVARRMMEARGFDYTQLLPSTVVVQAMLFTAMSSAYYVASDRLTGMSSRLASMPIHRAAPLLARSVGDMGRSAISVIVLVLVGIAAGMRFRAGLPSAVGFAGVAVIFAAVGSLCMGLIGAKASTPEGATSMATIPYLPLLMLSNGFAPVEDFSSWLRPFVRNQPVTRTIDLLRALVDGGPTMSPFLWWTTWMIGLSIVFVTLAGRVRPIR